MKTKKSIHQAEHKNKTEIESEINSKRSSLPREQSGSTGNLPLGLNIENRIAEDEKLRNLS